jgi:hypothetical protein
MFIQDLFENVEVDARYDAANDNSQLKMSDTRKTRLTLEQINKLRLMNDQRKIEMKQKLENIQKQYGMGTAAAAGGAGLGM